MKPYIYKATNKDTHEFYIGMRSAHKVDPVNDIGKIYFSSSNQVIKNKESFEFEIINIFEDFESTFKAENELIRDHWDNPLLLNKHYQKNSGFFSMAGMSRPDLTVLNIKLKRCKRETRTYECEVCRDTFHRIQLIHHPRLIFPLCSISCRNSHYSKHKNNKDNFPRIQRPRKIKKD